MKNSQNLFKVAAKFQRKYAQSQSLKEIIQNAASYGASSANGIMNFPAQLKKDKAAMTIAVTISSGIMGGLSVKVAAPNTDPPQFAAYYTKLPEQIQKYLDKYIKDFPQVPQGTQQLEWDFREPSNETGVAGL